jgi:phage-related minor tail protein
VSAGRPYMVGESGPELFVPRAAGSIVPNGQMGGGGVTVNVDMGQTVGAANPTQALDFGRKVRAAVVAVIANEKRPGGSLHPATA